MKTADIRNYFAVFLAALILSALLPLSFVFAADPPQIKPVEDFYDDSVWFQPDWADANKDADGLAFRPYIEDGAGQNGGSAAIADIELKTGGYSQGIISRKLDNDNWTGWRSFEVDLYLDGNPKGVTVKAKPVLFPAGKWNEANDVSAVVLSPKKWVTLKVALAGDIPPKYWNGWDPAKLAVITEWSVKIFAVNIPRNTEPFQVRIANPRLTGPVD